jgi:type III pantothenate kinase
MRLGVLIGNSSLRTVPIEGTDLRGEPVPAPWQAQEEAGFPLLRASLAGAPIDEVLVASVRPDRLDRLLDLLVATGLRVRVAGVDFPIPLRSEYARPEDAGVDRLLGAFAAHRAWPGSTAAVLDFGTALSVSVVSPVGVFRGGLIGLGEAAALLGLRAATPRLPPFAPAPPVGCVQDSTVEALSAGVFLQLLGGAQRIIDGLRAELPAPFVILVTGGGAVRFLEHLEGVDRHEPHLTLRGLALAAGGATGGGDGRGSPTG